MLKKIFTVLISLCLIFTLSVFASAAKISSAEVKDGNLSVKISGISKQPAVSDIKAKLGTDTATVKKSSYKAQSIEWIVMLDKSRSVHEDYFEASKAALCQLYSEKRADDILRVYTFDAEITQIIDSTESAEQATEKINAIPYDGQQTVFYDAVKTVSELCKSSKAKFCIPVLFTDGVDTQSKVTEAEAKKMLSANGFPVYAMYPDDIKSEEMKSLSALMTLSGGYAKGFSLTNLAQLFGKLQKTSGTLYLTLDIPEALEGGKEYTLSVSVFDSKPVTKNITLPAQAQATQKAEDEATNKAEQTTGAESDENEKAAFPIWIPAVGGAVLIIAVAALILLKKKKKKNEAYVKLPDKKNTAEIMSDEAAQEEESKEKKEKKEKAKKPEQKYRFYFVDKK